MNENFSLQDEIKKLEDSERRACNIIAMYLDERRPDLRTKEQYGIAFKRHIRPATQLSPFDDDQILKAVRQAKEFVPGWTLETLLKLITK
jgi:hypothetical protein